MEDQDYKLAPLMVVMTDTEIDEQMSKTDKINQLHTPMKSPHPREQRKGNQNPHGGCTGGTILQAVNTLTVKMDTQTELLLKFDKWIEKMDLLCNYREEAKH